MKVTYKLLIETAKENLEKLFNNSFLTNNMNNEPFANIVLKQISILNFAEDKEKVKQGSAKKWLEKLNLINSSSSKFTNVSKMNINEMWDELNYLHIYIKNVFKYDFNKNEAIDDVQKVESQPVNDNVSQNNNPYGNPFLGVNGFSPFGAQSPEAVQEQFYQQLAAQRMIQEIQSGKFYQYKTKPIAIVILKYIIGIIAIIFGTLVIAKVIISTVIGKINFPNNEGNYTPIPLISGFLFGDILTIIASFGLAFLMFRKNKNENFKYYFAWKFILLILIIFAVSVIMDLINYVDYYQRSGLWTDPKSNNSQETINLFFTYLYLMFTISSVYFFLLFISIFAVFFNPKLDIQRIELKQQEVYRQIKDSFTKSGKL